jgi:hypothetical protein
VLALPVATARVDGAYVAIVTTGVVGAAVGPWLVSANAFGANVLGAWVVVITRLLSTLSALAGYDGGVFATVGGQVTSVHCAGVLVLARGVGLAAEGVFGVLALLLRGVVRM